MVISRVSKSNARSSSSLLKDDKKNTKMSPLSSKNTSDSWVKKATGRGLSPGSMAPLSSAVNMAASAYGVSGSLFSLSFSVFFLFLQSSALMLSSLWG